MVPPRVIRTILAAAALTAAVTCPASRAATPRPAEPPDVYRDATLDFSSWAADPLAPGPDIPPSGRSLFDHLVSVRAGETTWLEVPFPFSALVDRVRSTLSAKQGYNGGTRQVMIPMGRSLQRTAAAPDFFKYPRIVLAVTGDAAGDRGDGAILLKDRLYIGYVEKTGILEVVSYNEAAGRFEFELVKDYRAGGSPRIQYANRAVCVSCHQNHAPIFAAAIWNETSANGRIAQLLRAHRTDFEQSAIVNVDFPDDIGKSTVRANALVPLQVAWQKGCAAPDSAASARCRAAAFTAVLQYGLSSAQDFDTGSATFQRDFAATFTRSWRDQWPDGMRVGSPILPDRNPFGDSTYYGGGATDEAPLDWTQATHVPPALDPLNPRGALETWRFSNTLDASRFIAGWATFFSADDFLAIDRHLASRGRGKLAKRTVYRARCTVSAASAPGAASALKCARDAGSARGVDLAGSFDPSRNVRVDWLNFGQSGGLRETVFDIGTASQSNHEHVIRARPAAQSASPRLPNGEAVEILEIRWGTDELGGGAPASGTATIEVVLVDDFAVARDAVEALLSGNPGIFDDSPLSRARLLRALFKDPEWSAKRWCCDDAEGLPTPRLDGAASSASALNDPVLRPLFQHCAVCHLSQERFPPNFLAGDADEVKRRVQHCAPRMWVRLSSWLEAGGHRVKSPMPPALFVRSLGMPPSAWSRSEELGTIRERIAKLVVAQTGLADPDDLMKRDYEGLPACLPDDRG